MSISIIAAATVHESAGFANMARMLKLSTGVPLVEADVVTAKRLVYLDGAQVGSTLTLTLSTVFFATLQNNALWTVDSIGFNFRDIVDDNVLEDGNRTYDVWYEIEPVGLPLMRWHLRISTINVPGI